MRLFALFNTTTRAKDSLSHDTGLRRAAPHMLHATWTRNQLAVRLEGLRLLRLKQLTRAACYQKGHG
jgi:hypothetical protein